jgi:protein-tyrosine phosphatase
MILPPRVLFVCLGNICRSPLAHGVFRAQAAQAGITVEVDSAGTGGWHAGDPPDARAQEIARTRGYVLSDLRARQVRAADFERFDLILAMDRSNLRDLQRLRPAPGDAALRLFLHPSEADVPDPYYDGGFGHVLDLVEEGCARLLDAIRRQGRG